MQQASGDLLAAARRAGDEHAAAGRRYPLDLLANMADRRRVAQQVVFRSSATAQFLVFPAQARGFHRAFDDQKQSIGLERLLDEIIGAELYRLDGCFDIAVAADHDDRQAGVLVLDDFQGFQPVQRTALEPDIEDDQRRPARPNRLKRAIAVGCLAGLIPLVPQNSGNQKTDVRLVIDDQNVMRHRFC
jgi:hypothetical protein